LTSRLTPAGKMHQTITQKFNDDLLLTESDRKLAFDLFPELAHVLDFPELRELFAHYEAEANRAKTSRRRAGSVAIIFAAVALLVASLTPLFEKSGTDCRSAASCAHWFSAVCSTHWLGVVVGIAALLGVAGTLIGSIGAFTRRSKERWLCNRLMTERLRQFQFQVLVCRIPEVLASTVDSQARERFVSDRKSWLREFRLTHEGRLAAKLRAVLEDDVEDDFLLHHNSESRHPLDATDRGLLRLFSAYRVLRLEHQLQYADYKLRPDERFFSSSCVRQLAILRDVSLVLIFVVFVAHLAEVLSSGVGSELPNTWVHVLIIWPVIGLLAVRAIEDGLQPGREVERYARYRSSISSLLTRFNRAAENPEEQIHLMLETERTVYQEMRGFLRTNHEARYVL
jgi:hypothetical protein